MRILRYTRRGMFFFKRINIGIRLVRSSIKTLTFQHYKYFIFCVIITITQLGRIFVTSYIDSSIASNVLITEFLSGQSFFEILIDYLKFPISYTDFIMIMLKNMLFLIELCILYLTHITIALYVHNNNTALKCFQIAISKYKVIVLWIILEMLVLLVAAVLGFIGDFLLFIWQLSTALTIQIIAFEKKTVFEILKSSFAYSKKMFGNVVGIDLFIDFILVALTALFYYLYQTNVVPTFNFLTSENESNSIITVIFYILSMVQVLETITFTNLYDLFHKHPKNLNLSHE